MWLICMKFNCKNMNISIIHGTSNPKDFKCGDPDLEKYLKEDAFYDLKNRLSITWLVRMDDVIIGYFTLANASINANLINRARSQAGISCLIRTIT